MAMRVVWLGVGALLVAAMPMQAADKPDTEPAKKVAHEVGIDHSHMGLLGVRLEDVGAEDVKKLQLAEERGARVVDVVKDSPAAAAGVQKDDVIVEYQGQRVESAAELARMVRETPPGRKVSLEVSRAGKVVTLSPTLGAAHNTFFWRGESEGEGQGEGRGFHFRMPPMPPMPTTPQGRHPGWMGMGMMPGMECPMRPRKLGITFQEISGQLAQYFHAPGDTAVLVTSVDDDSPAAKAGLKAGDLILQLGETKIDDAESLHDAVEEAKAGAATKITLQRDGKSMSLDVALGGSEKPEHHPPMRLKHTL
jgi:serine protease Do